MSMVSQEWEMFRERCKELDRRNGHVRGKGDKAFCVGLWRAAWKRRDLYVANGAKGADAKRKVVEELGPCLEGADIPEPDRSWAPDISLGEIYHPRDKGDVQRARIALQKAVDKYDKETKAKSKTRAKHTKKNINIVKKETAFSKRKRAKAMAKEVQAEYMREDGQPVDIERIFSDKNRNDDLLVAMKWVAQHCDPRLDLEPETAPSPLAIVWAEDLRANPVYRAKFLQDVVQKAAQKQTPEEDPTAGGAKHSISLIDEIAAISRGEERHSSTGEKYVEFETIEEEDEDPLLG